MLLTCWSIAINLAVTPVASELIIPMGMQIRTGAKSLAGDSLFPNSCFAIVLMDGPCDGVPNRDLPILFSPLFDGWSCSRSAIFELLPYSFSYTMENNDRSVKSQEKNKKTPASRGGGFQITRGGEALQDKRQRAAAVQSRLRAYL